MQGSKEVEEGVDVAENEWASAVANQGDPDPGPGHAEEQQQQEESHI